MSTRSTNMKFVRCEHGLPYFCRYRYAINTNMEVVEGYLELQCWSFDKKYSNMYLMHGETHRTRALESAILQRTAVHSQILVGWHDLKMFTVPSKDRDPHFVTVPAFWRY